jgi:hypothetical protein
MPGKERLLDDACTYLEVVEKEFIRQESFKIMI